MTIPARVALAVALLNGAVALVPAPSARERQQRVARRELTLLAGQTIEPNLGSTAALGMSRSQIVVDPPLERVPSGERLVSSVDVDRQGNIYILQRGVAKPIMVADRSGRVLRSWGEGLFKLPHGIRVDPSGNVWTLDANTSMVYKFSAEGNRLLEIAIERYPPTTPRPPNTAAPLFVGPSDIAFGTNGHVFIADGYANSRVLEFDAVGTKIREWGEPGTGPGQFRVLHGIAVGPDSNLYVADRENQRVQRFTLQGRYLGEWRYPGRVFSLDFGENGEFYLGVSIQPRVLPAGVAATEGRVFKVDANTGEIIAGVQSPFHSVAVAADGSILTGSEGAVVKFTPAR